MKVIELTPLKSFSGQPIAGPDNVPVTMKSCFLNQLGLHQSSKGEECISVFALGVKIQENCEDVLELEDAEVQLLQSVLEARPAYTALVMGQLFEALKKASEPKARPKPTSIPKTG